jgi:hypothetical protein
MYVFVAISLILGEELYNLIKIFLIIARENTMHAQRKAV